MLSPSLHDCLWDNSGYKIFTGLAGMMNTNFNKTSPIFTDLRPSSKHCCWLFQKWYNGQMKLVCDWLTDRLDSSLHPYQLTCLMNMTRVSRQRHGHRDTMGYVAHQGPNSIYYRMSSYQYRKSHCGDKTVVRSSYLHNGISYGGKISLYCIRAQVVIATGAVYYPGLCNSFVHLAPVDEIYRCPYLQMSCSDLI